MKIKDMPAGPEMDRLVAEKWMGWGPTACGSFANGRGRGMESFFPTTDIDHAWEVLERMDTMTLRKLPGGSYACAHMRDGVLYHGLGETAPLAICRAALIAVGCEVVP